MKSPDQPTREAAKAVGRMNAASEPRATLTPAQQAQELFRIYRLADTRRIWAVEHDDEQRAVAACIRQESIHDCARACGDQVAELFQRLQDHGAI